MRNSVLYLGALVAACVPSQVAMHGLKIDEHSYRSCVDRGFAHTCKDLADHYASNGRGDVAWEFTRMSCKSATATYCVSLWNKYAAHASSQTEALRVLDSACERHPNACERMAHWHQQRGHHRFAAEYIARKPDALVALQEARRERRAEEAEYARQDEEDARFKRELILGVADAVGRGVQQGLDQNTANMEIIRAANEAHRRSRVPRSFSVVSPTTNCKSKPSPRATPRNNPSGRVTASVAWDDDMPEPCPAGQATTTAAPLGTPQRQTTPSFTPLPPVRITARDHHLVRDRIALCSNGTTAPRPECTATSIGVGGVQFVLTSEVVERSNTCLSASPQEKARFRLHAVNNSGDRVRLVTATNALIFEGAQGELPNNNGLPALFLDPRQSGYFDYFRDCVAAPGTAGWFDVEVYREVSAGSGKQ